jgi:signal transduction histidine kinase
MLIRFSGCDALGIWLKEGGTQWRCETRRQPRKSFHFKIIPCKKNKAGEFVPILQENSSFEKLCWEIFLGHIDHRLRFFTRNGSLSTHPLDLTQETQGQVPFREISFDGPYKSLAVIPLVVGNERIGLLQLKNRRANAFTPLEIESYEGVAQNVAMALMNQRAQAALLERVKELTCLYNIAQIAEQPGMSTEEVFQSIVNVLPPAWQYQDMAASRIIFDGQIYETQDFPETRHKQTAQISVRGVPRGTVEVVYREERPDLDEGPFLKEERKLIDNVARQVAIIVERREAEEDKSKLQVQLRHADRLATIGQLAAGVAHELNEPLSSILGFAQLAKKSPGLPNQAEQDLDRIVTASLHAREIIKKLMLFARQTPPRKTQVNLNQVVEDGLYFIEARCAKAGIELIRVLSADLPEITADPAQINQALVNLVVNAVQAMPEGGKLVVKTSVSKDHVSLIVEDTGIGMSEEVKKQVFIPFFTTKDIDQGTGLGLAVVHGIVTSHRGSITVESTVDAGTQFEIQLPVTMATNAKENGENA